MVPLLETGPRRVLFTILLFVSVAIPAQAKMTLRQEREFGQRLLAQLRQQVEFIHDQEVVQYVADAGHKVLAHVENPLFDYRFFVIKDDGLNAFAIPGGFIFVHSGLLEVIDTDDELICVLAHEIGHVQGRHIARRIERMKRLNIASIAALLLGVFLGKGQAGSALLATTTALNASLGLKYSREDEEEADRRAFQWLCKAGYNPRGLITVLDKMQRMRWLGSDAIPSYLSTHPGSAQRITYLEDLLKGAPRCNVPIRRASQELRRIQVRLTVETKDPYQLIKRYERSIIQSPKDEYIRYGLALAYLKAKNYELAIKYMKDLVATYANEPLYVKDLGVAYYTKGDYKDAIRTLKLFLDKRPDDMEARLFLGKAYLEAKRANKALQYIKEVYYALGRDPEVAFDLGRAYAALHRDGDAHYYFYLYYQWTGDGDAATYHRRMAMRLLPKDSPQRRRLEKSEGHDTEKGKSTDSISDSRDDSPGP